MNFTRGLDPKVAMGVGIKKCSRCHNILSPIEKGWISEDLCQKCVDELYPEPKKTFKWTWNRLTFFGKILFISMAITATMLIYMILTHL